MANELNTMPDPILAAIDAHREAVGKFDTENERLAAAGGPDGSNWHPAQAALLAATAAKKALVDTAPTTHAGLRALEDYLYDEDNRSVVLCIEQTGTTEDGCTYITWGGPDSVRWLIAKRAAEIDGVTLAPEAAPRPGPIIRFLDTPKISKER
jgi:hypothetical protein